MSRAMKIARNLFIGTLFMGVVGAICAAGLVLWALMHFGQGLPDYTQLADYEPPVVTRIHAGDGSMLAEYARQKRLFVPVSAMPKPLINAFLAAEDQNFYQHAGLDYVGITRAVIFNIRNVIVGRRPVGASTITQQVAKNFLLTNEVSYERKIKEAILAYRIERAYTKDQILELYLNEIYLGYGSYGVAAAAFNYFNKALDELTLDEMAYLAALPKAPNNYHPVRRKGAAIGRRNWVIGRMLEEGFVDRAQAKEARSALLITRKREETKIFRADYFSEEIRRKLYNLYGEKKLYEGGLSVRTTLSPKLQEIAERTLRNGLVAYDLRHGWRGPVRHWDLDAILSDQDGEGQEASDDDLPRQPLWATRLQEADISLGMPRWKLAIVLEVASGQASIGLSDSSRGTILLDDMKWAGKWLPDQRFGGRPKAVDEVLKPGDVIVVEKKKIAKDEAKKADAQASSSPPTDIFYTLRQIPDVGGAVVAMDPHTGRVLAMVGGYDYQISEYNRATQANRQPGSAFKPFVYAAALDAGFTPSSLVLDAPFVIDQGFGQGKWKPTNYSEKFYGPSTLRLGIEKSRNLMTVRLAQYIGMDKVVDYANRFGIEKDMQPTLAMALGAGETTLMQMTTAYAMLVNGGKKITPVLIDRIQNRYGETILRRDERACEACQVEAWEHQQIPQLPDNRPQIVDPRIAYQVVSMLQGVIERGTGRIVASVNRPLAGKTGTTNDSNDAWFIGFSPDLVVGVYTGFDQPRTLGASEQGASVAAPIFRDFMWGALKNSPAVPFRIPPGVRLVRVDGRTGLPSRSGGNTILEAFLPGTEPTAEREILDGVDSLAETGTKVRVGTGGLY